MNVLEYSIKVGRQLRKTDEGRTLLDIVNRIDEKYHDNNIYGIYNQFVDNQVNRYYFSSHRVIYQTLLNVLNVLNEKDNPEKQSLIPVTELINNDDLFKELVEASDGVARVFDLVAHGCLTGEDISEKIPKNWKFRMRDAISDVQLAVSRTLIKKNFAVYNFKNQGFLYTDKAKEYFDLREKNRILPFTQESIDMMNSFIELADEEKMIYEKMFLVREAINQGIFFGFYGRIHEMQEEEVCFEQDLEESQLKEISIVSNDFRIMGDKSWLYKIYTHNEYLYYMAHSKQLRYENNSGNATILGVVYPKDDRRLFENSFAS